MAKYRLKKHHYLDDRLRRGGETVDWDGPPSLSMEPVDAPAQKAKDAWEADRKQRRVTKSSVGWTPGLKSHMWGQLTRSDPDLGGEATMPMANVNVVGQVKKPRGRPRAQPVEA